MFSILFRYVWLKKFLNETAQLHLKQSRSNKSGHWPFIDEYNNLETDCVFPCNIISRIEINSALSIYNDFVDL